MYLNVLEKLKVDPSQCLYVGDGNSEELTGAKDLGMTTVWVDNAHQQYWKDRFVPGGDHEITSLRDLTPIVDAILQRGGLS